MTWQPKPKEIDALLSSPAKRRLEYSIGHICDTQRVWGLYNEGWASLENEDGQALLALWPHRLYAEQMIAGPWADYKPEPILLSELLDEWLPKFKENSSMLAVFPVPSGGAAVLTALSLETTLRDYLRANYGED